MPKPIGSPITITGGQPQREVARFQVDVTLDVSGTYHFTASGFGQVRLRDAVGNILQQDPTLVPIVTVPDASIPAGIRTAFTNVCNFLDTQ